MASTAENQRKRREDIRAGRIKVAHGLIESYNVAGCRCVDCLAAYHRVEQAKAARWAAMPGSERQAKKQALAAKRKRCKVEGCEYPSQSRGWCNTHYSQYHRGRTPHPVNPKTPPAGATLTPGALCSVPGCRRRVRAWGWCDTHYAQYRRGKQPGAIRKLVRLSGTSATVAPAADSPGAAPPSGPVAR